MNLFIELIDLNNVYYQPNRGDEEETGCEVVVLLIEEPIGHTEDQEDV